MICARGKERFHPAHTSVCFNFILEGMFLPSATAGGFLCGGLEPQPRNDECFEPTAEFILVTSDGRTERDLPWVSIQSKAPLWWI